MNKLIYVLLILLTGLLAGPVIAGGDIAAGQVLAADCGGCHGDAGEGMDDAPALAGLDFGEHVAMLKGYRDGSREGDMMQMFSSELSDDDINNLAAYYASLGK